MVNLPSGQSKIMRHVYLKQFNFWKHEWYHTVNEEYLGILFYWWYRHNTIKLHHRFSSVLKFCYLHISRVILVSVYEGHSKSSKPNQEGVALSKRLYTVCYIVPLNINTLGRAMFVHCNPLTEEACSMSLPPPPRTPLQHRLFPKWRPGRCDLNLGNK